MKVVTPEGYTFVTKFQEDNSHKVLRSVDFFSIKFDEIFFDTVCWAYSGVVGRERMGTAFPHKKLSGNGVPTREILRFYCYFYYQMLPCYNIPCSSNHVMTGHQKLQSI